MKNKIKEAASRIALWVALAVGGFGGGLACEEQREQNPQNNVEVVQKKVEQTQEKEKEKLRQEKEKTLEQRLTGFDVMSAHYSEGNKINYTTQVPSGGRGTQRIFELSSEGLGQMIESPSQKAVIDLREYPREENEVPTIRGRYKTCSTEYGTAVVGGNKLYVFDKDEEIKKIYSGKEFPEIEYIFRGDEKGFYTIPFGGKHYFIPRDGGKIETRKGDAGFREWESGMRAIGKVLKEKYGKDLETIQDYRKSKDGKGVSVLYELNGNREGLYSGRYDIK